MNALSSALSPGDIEYACLPADLIPKREHLPIYQHMFHGASRVEPLQLPWQFNRSLRTWRVARVVLLHSDVGATRYMEGSDSSAGNGSILLKLVQQGFQTGVMSNDEYFEVETGGVILRDLSAGATVTATPGATFSIMIPRHLLPRESLLNSLSPNLSWPRHSPQARVLAPVMTAVLDALPRVNGSGALTMIEGLLGMLNQLLKSEPVLASRQHRQSHRLAAMKAYLEEHLKEADLGVERLCEAFHCSRATVYRLFKDDGGIAHYIQRARLEGCLREITRLQDARPGLLSAIAHDWGFSDNNRFSRLFKELHGVSPGEVLASRTTLTEPRRAVADSSQGRYWREAEQVRDWLGQLG